MARYDFICDECRLTFEVSAPMKDGPPPQVCIECGGEVRQDFSGIRIDVFKPYVDEHMTGEPVEIRSKWQRDAMLKDKGLSYDTNRYHRHRTPLVSDLVKPADVLKHLREKGPIRAPKEEPADVPDCVPTEFRHDAGLKRR